MAHISCPPELTSLFTCVDVSLTFQAKTYLRKVLNAGEMTSSILSILSAVGGHRRSLERSNALIIVSLKTAAASDSVFLLPERKAFCAAVSSFIFAL